MTDATLPTGPDPEAIISYLTTTYPATDVVTIPGAWFFSLDAVKHWPNYATIVTTDEHDMGSPSNMSARPGSLPTQPWRRQVDIPALRRRRRRA